MAETNEAAGSRLVVCFTQQFAERAVRRWFGSEKEGRERRD